MVVLQLRKSVVIKWPQLESLSRRDDENSAPQTKVLHLKSDVMCRPNRNRCKDRRRFRSHKNAGFVLINKTTE